jgi:glycosyltransferase involved in cell wall biosynthesis
MRLVFFTHPEFMRSQSMPRFARMLQRACLDRGHQVSVWAPRDGLHRWFAHTRLAKWAGYVDQYLIFPWWVRRQLAQTPDDTLFVFCDQALGPWVPLVAHRPHLVHAHDLLALRSALGQIPENPTRLTGRLYQRFIRRGFRQASHFIAISERTRSDLVTHAGIAADRVVVIHNSQNHGYAPLSAPAAQARLAEAGLPPPGRFLLHVGGGQWYKNTEGVIRLYGELVRRWVSHPPSADHAAAQGMPALVMVSPEPGEHLKALVRGLPPQARVLFCQGVTTEVLEAAYSGCVAMLFPSLAEGFGWPIIEAMACGAPVVTSQDAPMNEIGGSHALYLPILTSAQSPEQWAAQGAGWVDAWLQEAALQWVQQFEPSRVKAAYLAEYERVWLQGPTAQPTTASPARHAEAP